MLRLLGDFVENVVGLIFGLFGVLFVVGTLLSVLAVALIPIGVVALLVKWLWW